MKKKEKKVLKIVVSGNVGVGKSTLCKKLLKHYKQNTYIKECMDCPHLIKFVEYLAKNPDKYNPHSFPTEKYFLEERFEKLLNFPKDQKIFIQDRFLIEMYEIFIKTARDKNYLNKEEFIKLEILYKNLLKKIDLPDIIIFLKGDLNCLMKRIKKRGIDYEQDNIDGFVFNLKSKYENFIEVLKKKFPSISVFEINSSNLNADLVRDKTCEIIDRFLN